MINVVTKKGEALKGLLIAGDGGSLQTGRARGAYGTTFGNGVDLILSGLRSSSQGEKRLFFSEFDDPATHSGVSQNLDGDANYHLFGSLSFKGLSFQGGFGTRAKDVPTAPFGSWFNDPRMKTRPGLGRPPLRP